MTSTCAAAQAVSESAGVGNFGDDQVGDDGSGAPSVLPRAILQEGMAADIAELRALVMAAAKHFNIEVPSNKERPSTEQDDVDFESIKPRNADYDEETTIKRHISFLPHESMLNGVADWNYLFRMDAPAVKPNIPPRNLSESTEGLQVVLEWPLTPSLSSEVIEFGYTADGYPCELSDEPIHTTTSNLNRPPDPPSGVPIHTMGAQILVESDSGPRMPEPMFQEHTVGQGPHVKETSS